MLDEISKNNENVNGAHEQDREYMKADFQEGDAEKMAADINEMNDTNDSAAMNVHANEEIHQNAQNSVNPNNSEVFNMNRINPDGGYSDNWGNDNLKKQIEAEREKVNRKAEAKRRKQEKKAAKKAAKKGKKPGVIFMTVRFVVCAAAFGVIALGTMYFTGDALGLFDKDEGKTKTIVTSTKVGSDNSSKEEAVSTSAKNESDSSGKTVVTDVSDVVENVMPSIVAITSKQKVQYGLNSWYGYYYGNNKEYQEETGAGSGIIIGQNDTELLIITNNHVVEGADSLMIKFIDDEDVEAVVKGTDSDKDLAVVSVKLSDIKDSTLDAIKIATLGDSDELKVGEGTIAIGNALGYGQSVTVGVVSALDREVAYEDKTMTLIQTDAAINPGNSGGALLNTKGEVIGINAAKYSSSSVEGMGFAIPVSSVSDVIDELMNHETLVKVDDDKKGYINIYGRDVTTELSQTYDAPVGVLVVEVLEGGAADKAGIEKSDIITKVNKDKVSSMEELQSKLEYYEKGETVTFTIQYLDGKKYVEKELDVVLGDKME